MKVHPVQRNQNITVRHASSISQTGALTCSQKKLRRLPHIFAKVLELPFQSDADVSVEETVDFLKFGVSTYDVGQDIRAHAIEIYPGVSKIVIRPNNDVADSFVDELELHLRRFRLLESTLPELATATYSEGELVITVPKGRREVGDKEKQIEDL